MIRNIIAGFWVCGLTLASCYGAVMWATRDGASKPQPALVGLQYKKLPPLNIPVIAEGAVQGYVVANMVFTADAETLRQISIPAEAIVQDEAFRYIYADETLDFRRLSRYDVNAMIANVRANVNKRLGAEIVKEILLENFNYVDKADVRS
ncbi:hypothetical protein [Microvirga roseola]|uniref:hypothetical protein n=1 Tax=Microvirga roseola TaxID=2883126 RepID=UPI001E346243|nr:hypothetical protein [Microvirga roseola]